MSAVCLAFTAELDHEFESRAYKPAPTPRGTGRLEKVVLPENIELEPISSGTCPPCEDEQHHSDELYDYGGLYGEEQSHSPPHHPGLLQNYSQ